MQVTKTDISSTQVKLNIVANDTELNPIKNSVVKKFSKDIKLPGFRPGTAPLSLVEKNVDQQALQTEFLDEAMTQLYSHALQRENIRPVSRPDVSIKKFVPFSTLEFEVTIHVVSPIELPDYKTIKIKKETAEVTKKDIDDVLKSLKLRIAEKKDVQRASKNGDQVWIDFSGVDDKGKAIKGADGKDYPLILGSDTFIPGFEKNIIGMKPEEEKTFNLTFPKNYALKALASKKVIFTVKLKKVQEIIEPKIDEAFAAKVGPFKTVAELKEDIKKQLTTEKTNELNAKHQNEVMQAVVDKTKVDVPEPLIDHQIQHNLEDLKRNLTYRGQTYQEFLEVEGLSEEEYKKTIAEPQAIQQLKASFVLSEIAEKENLQVTPEELEIRLQLLKEQYKSDPKMLAELDKPENLRDIASRMLNEKAITKLVE